MCTKVIPVLIIVIWLINKGDLLLHLTKWILLEVKKVNISNNKKKVLYQIFGKVYMLL